jgi:hypothetical protein
MTGGERARGRPLFVLWHIFSCSIAVIVTHFSKMSELHESDDSDDDGFPEMGMGALSAETLALLVDFLPNRRFEDAGPTDDGRVNEAQACVAYTQGDALQITATLKRLAQQH